MPSSSVPAAGAYVVDTGSGKCRIGRVSRSQAGRVYVSPPGGGAEWVASPGDLRAPDEREWATIRALTTPVPPAPVVVLSADHGLRPRPEPAPGCTACAHLVRWFDLYAGAGARHDESAAVDCVVEIRNHPHDPPKMRIEPAP